MIRMVRNSNEYVYVLSENCFEHEEYGTVRGFGITIIGKTERVTAEDISDNFQFVNDLFDVIVEEKLYPEHLLEVIEDYLSGNYSEIIPINFYSRFPYIA